MARRITTLKRYGHKGQFVAYPDKWQRRMVHTGKRRYDTSCDFIVGFCACGLRHTEDEGWVRELLHIHNNRIESHEEWLIRTRKES
jgi:hypothetical protein